VHPPRSELAKGEVNGDFLACPYHGWAFDGATGECRYVPSLLVSDKRIPATARVRSYPAHEQWGHVWTALAPVVHVGEGAAYLGLLAPPGRTA
jgi:phenylpropionate dioxygenase-like ring-hydroxylating dioxygenase large terminal subunit